MKAAIDQLREHLKYLDEELLAEQRKLVELEKSLTYRRETVVVRELSRSQVTAAIAKLEGK